MKKKPLCDECHGELHFMDHEDCHANPRDCIKVLRAELFDLRDEFRRLSEKLEEVRNYNEPLDSGPRY